MEGKTRKAPPRANAMLESLRGLGYSTPAALADIVDNSISAGANIVHIDFSWLENRSRVSVIDNGSGMSDPDLENALRLGDKNPLHQREPHDLGRFGMGLKTASFSQCRRLTVSSKKDGVVSCLRWDLDEIAADPNGEWLLHEGPAAGSEEFLEALTQMTSGTLVLWEVLDRIVTPGYIADDFNDLIDATRAHLAMVFHRMLDGPNASLSLMLNGERIRSWDPFLAGHTAKTWNTPVAKFETAFGRVELEAHVLPHKDMLSADEFETAAGPGGWTAQQGFYVYRNRRLLVAGGWLGLGSGKPWNREEIYRLARIRLDIPNTADADWKIDVKKSTARPPVTLRPWLTRIAQDTRDRARRVFAFRGTATTAIGKAPIEHAWRVDHTKAGVRYRIDLKHPVVASVLELSGENDALIKAMLRVIEETVPIQRIWLDTAEQHDPPKAEFSGEPPEKVLEILKVLYQDLRVRKGMTSDAAARVLLATAPFQNYPALIEQLVSKPGNS